MSYKTLHIGRNGEQTQQLAQRSISGEHATLSFAGEDCGSYKLELKNVQNSIWVNGVSVVVAECGVTDDVCLGDDRIKLDMRALINDLRQINNLPLLGSEPKGPSKPDNGQLQGSPDSKNRYSEIIPAKGTVNKQKQERKPDRPTKESDVPPTPERAKEPVVTEKQMEKLAELYAGYESFTRLENLKSFLVKMGNGVPVIALLVVRIVAGGSLSLLVLISGFFLLQAFAIILLQEHMRRTQKRKAHFMSRFRNEYRCPVSPDKPLFYTSGNLPIPFADLEDGTNCELCGRKCKKLSK